MNNWIENLEKLTLENSTIKESEILLALPSELHSEWDNFLWMGSESISKQILA